MVRAMESALYLLQVVPAQRASLKILAAILLVVLICGLIYVLRNFATLKTDENSQALRGPRNNFIFIACATTFAVVCLLLYLVAAR